MATHDYVIANGTGAAVRSDLNGALAAIVSQNSNASEPATMYAYQWWADTTTGLLKIRNAANSAWVTIGTLASANLGLLPLAGGTMTGVLAVTAGTAALPGIAVSGDTNTGIYSPGADQVAISTGGTGRLFVDASGRVGASNSSPGSYNASADDFVVGSSADTGLTIVSGTSSQGSIFFADGTTGGAQQAAGYLYYLHSNDSMTLGTSNSPRITITSAGLVGIDVTSPSDLLHLNGNIRVVWGANRVATVFDNSFRQGMAFDTTNRQLQIFSTTSDTGGSIGFFTRSTAGSSDTDYGTEKVRIDVSGRLLVGTSTNTNNIRLQQSLGVVATGSNSYPGAAFTAYSGTNTAAAPIIDLKRSRGTTDGSMTAVGIGDFLGYLAFNGADGTNFIEAASIIAVVDGTPGTNDMPGRLVFSTTADGAASPTERMRITNAGIIVAKTNSDDINIGGTLGPCIASTSRCGFAFSTNSLLPTNGAGTLSDNGISLGLGSYRWSVVYAGTGTINTSDANLKQDIDSLSVAELTVAANIKSLIKKFRFKDAVEAKGDDARIHVGVIAQEVAEAFVNAGLDPYCYGLFCEDELEDGSKRLGIRYDELLAFVIASL